MDHADKYAKIQGIILSCWGYYDASGGKAMAPKFREILDAVRHQMQWEEVNLNSVLNLIEESFRSRRMWIR